MWYVYILRSNKDKQLYVGLTNDLKKRINEHNMGKVSSTYLRRPFKIIYYEVHTNRYDAAKRERFLKTGWGKNWIKRTLENYFQTFKS
ncbi:MAG: excinuclease ABC subunit C [Candidatus Nealsonbacteria bacterium CG23_combo_of_CG06-09_8_20_14_all_37_18]|uniref:Excinuclease ABC subunit C n=1 Tax=Candidatus Nealsonbacteria bacterium CG23_combo_of_CG06-09_8_20_14_all_37_18 TaxID=1974720 RepID=A0A2G9YZ72_9BACT|nr:MAG: excinuclease ABC subunit C [Candidatus Nealsonbacteria bacterium CG23_combo_of_CG06-09_8_20_14_all_37_18]